MKIIQPKKCINGIIQVPGDKSISHRAVMIGSLAKGTTIVNNFLFSNDCLSTIACFRDMGIDIYSKNKNLIINGKGIKGLSKPNKSLDAGNSGTTIRLLSGILAGQDFDCEITGDASLKSRPMDRIINPLTQMGASILSKDNLGFAPLKIKGSKLNAIHYKMPLASAQVKSSLIFASLYTKNTTIIEEPTPSRNHTELMLKEFGANINTQNNLIYVSPVKELYPKEIHVPADISSASFFIVASLILKNSHIIIKNVGINPTRTGLISILKKMGANINIINKKTNSTELIGDIEVKSSNLKGITLEGSIIPKMIDEIPIFVVACNFANGTTTIKDASELKFKESNRIDTITKELNKMGANIIKTKDGMIINPVQKLKGTAVESYKDHRIAMSLAIAGLCAENKTIINNSDCVNISFPNFFEILENI